MTEKQLQQQCVTWFHNTYPSFRGHLFMVKNETDKGANYAPLGLVRGVSDLVLIDSSGLPVFIELKVKGTRHDVKHLKEQTIWLKKMTNLVGAIGLFCSDFDVFRKIVESRFETYSDYASDVSFSSISYAKDLIFNAKTKTALWNN